MTSLWRPPLVFTFLLLLVVVTTSSPQHASANDDEACRTDIIRGGGGGGGEEEEYDDEGAGGGGVEELQQQRESAPPFRNDYDYDYDYDDDDDYDDDEGGDEQRSSDRGGGGGGRGGGGGGGGGAHDHDGHDHDDLFYAWPADGEIPLIDALFPDPERLRSAWEVHPLLSRVSFDHLDRDENHTPLPRRSLREEEEEEEEEDDGANDDGRMDGAIIPTIFHDRALLSRLNANLDRRNRRGEGGDRSDRRRPDSSGGDGGGGGEDDHRDDDDPLLSLFAVDDIPQILSRGGMKHHVDYKLVKKVVLPPPPHHATDHPDDDAPGGGGGEEYSGSPPEARYTLEEIVRHFHYGKFSIVINKMQHRWRQIAMMGRRMEEELGATRVGANLYLTPMVMDTAGGDNAHNNGDVRQGFEAHWDWMDVIVIQLSGRKRWSVAREPSIYLSNKDQKRKPTMVELEALRRYSDITLCPGDVLYIPRGHIHNASTIVFDNLSSESSSNDGESGVMMRRRRRLDLDNCPSYPKGVPLATQLADRLDGPSLHLTFGLLQSTGSTVESLLHHALDAYFASRASNTHEKVASPARACPSTSSGRVTKNYHDLEWRTVFHHSLAEVARREHACDNILPSHNSTMIKSRRCVGSVILRMSVPLLLLGASGNKSKEVTGDDRQLANLKRTYFLALDAFRSHASIPKTMDFAQRLLESTPDEELAFSYPGYAREDGILCPEALRTLSEDTHMQHLKSFDQFAVENFGEVLKGMDLWGEKMREENRRRQESDLDAVGQGGGTRTST